MNIKKTCRHTRQKEIVLLVLQGAREHPTADWIYEQARKQIPRISKGTVYRNLAVLRDEGKISELELIGTVARYEIRREPHDHFQCHYCGRIIDLKQPVDTGLDRKVEKKTGLKISYHQLEFRGVCLDCQVKIKVT
jgi:Fe2+ or Zn2+ uptake regulation protein